MADVRMYSSYHNVDVSVSAMVRFVEVKNDRVGVSSTVHRHTFAEDLTGQN